MIRYLWLLLLLLAWPVQSSAQVLMAWQDANGVSRIATPTTPIPVEVIGDSGTAFSGEVTNAGTFAVQVTSIPTLDTLIVNEDDGTASTDPGIIPFCRETASPANTGGSDLDLGYFQCTGGYLNVKVQGIAVDVTEDVAETAGGTGPMVLSVRRDVAASSGGAGDNVTFNTDALGLLWTRNLDPCSGVAKTYIPIDIVTATTTEITPSLAGSSTHYYICSLNLVTNAANNVAVVDDNTDGCGSVTAGIFGGFGSAAEGWNFGANGGIALGNGTGSVGRTTTSNAVICIITSAATQLSGMMVVAAAP